MALGHRYTSIAKTDAFPKCLNSRPEPRPKLVAKTPIPQVLARMSLCQPPMSICGKNAFSSQEPTILLASGRNRELWEQPFQACPIDADCVKPDGKNSVIPFVISKWLLSELSFSDRWSRGTNTLGTRLGKTSIPCGHASDQIKIFCGYTIYQKYLHSLSSSIPLYSAGSAKVPLLVFGPLGPRTLQGQ